MGQTSCSKRLSRYGFNSGKFPKLKLNFNIVPALLDAILDYTENGYHDIHSELTVSDTENLTDEEKAFILNNFSVQNTKQ